MKDFTDANGANISKTSSSPTHLHVPSKILMEANIVSSSSALMAW
jgi:hypothetical protein